VDLLEVTKLAKKNTNFCFFMSLQLGTISATSTPHKLAMVTCGDNVENVSFSNIYAVL